jgi:hypothetical protein
MSALSGIAIFLTFMIYLRNANPSNQVGAGRDSLIVVEYETLI